MCDVCFDDDRHSQLAVCLGNARYQAASKYCTLAMCPGCLDEYLRICLQNRSLPRCPGCRSLLDPFVKSVRSACRRWLDEWGHDSLWRQGADYGEIVRKVVQSRNQYLVDNFPKAVTKLAHVMFPDKLRHIRREQKQRIHNMLERTSSSLMCIMSGCFGTALEDPQTGRRRCLTCSNEQCPKCREVWLSDEHVCDPDILQSLEAIGRMRACPACGVPIERSEGCNHMTCATCGCHFMYDSGHIGGHGSHNRPIVDLNTLLYGTANSVLAVRQLLERMPFLEPWLQHMREAWELCRQAPPAKHDRVAFMYRLSGRQLFLNRSAGVVEHVLLAMTGKDDDELRSLVHESLDVSAKIDKAYHVPQGKNQRPHRDDRQTDAPAREG